MMVKRVQNDSEYERAFHQILGENSVLALPDIVHAIAMYERT